MINRKIELEIEDGFEVTEGATKCIQYLMTWAMHSERYKFVAIYSRGSDELTAVYREKEDERPTYVIGGIRRENDQWSTHS